MGAVLATPVYVRSGAVYLPPLRIRREEYVRSLGAFSAAGVEEKAVAELDEDAVTMAVEAARAALEIDGPSGRGETGSPAGIYLASTTLPYAEKVQASTIGEALGLGNGAFCSEYTTSARAGTEALICACCQAALEGDVVLVVGAEAPRVSPVHPEEHALGAGAAALVLAGQGWGRVLGWYSCAGERLGTRFRPAGSVDLHDLPLGAYAQQALRTAVVEAVTGVSTLLGDPVSCFKVVVLPQPDPRTAVQLGRALGLKPEQASPGVIAARWGDLGSASTLAALCLAAVTLEAGDRVLAVSYGSGQAADAVALEVTSAPVVAIRSAEPGYIGFADLLRRRAP